MKQLRHFTFAILALILISIFSCSKDDDDKVVNPIIGTWEYAESIEGFSMTVTVTFNANHTGTMHMAIVIDGESESESSSFTYSTDGSQLTITENGESVVVTYSISGDTLTLTEDGEQMVYHRV
ncbi:lipocalin family protein [Draconibacterium mangrovi]|uniref:lipocalin family protein n=1 Tax=Draconibacterium mangrovi TaxID=2697469 RepID=UPI0013D02D6E|nr:lipocalin family protein [Draconibacterium mangrovi]